MKKYIYRAALIISAVLTALIPPAASALTDDDLILFKEIGNIFYNRSGTACYSGGSLTGDGNFAKIVDYFSGNNLKGIVISAEGIAGIVANFSHESALSPFRNQGQSSSPTGNMSARNGYGIAQFTPRTKVLPSLQSDPRTASLFNQYYDQKYGGSPSSNGIPEGVPTSVNDAWLAVQLDFIVDSEFTTTKLKSYRNVGGTMGLDYLDGGLSILDAMNQAESPEDAARVFVWIYERPADKPGGAIRRGETARNIFPEVLALLDTSVPNTGSNPTGFTTDGSDITIIGDSITAHSQSDILNLLPNADIHTQADMQFYDSADDNLSGITILNQLIANNQLRDILIYSLGVNGPITLTQAQTVVNAAGPDRTVVFVSNYAPDKDYIVGNNNTFTRIAQDNPNVYVADWSGAINTDVAAYIGPDNIHPTNPAGTQLFAETLHAAIVSNQASHAAQNCEAGVESTLPIGNPTDSSVDVPCDPRTIDLGIHDGWTGGVRTSYRFCSVPNLPVASSQGNSIHQAAGRTDLFGQAILNSRVAGAVFSMVEAARADGVTLTASNVFRSFDWTVDNCNLSASQKATLLSQRQSGKVDRICNKPSSEFAPPGYSNHGAGVAIDFTGHCGGKTGTYECSHPIYDWLRVNAQRFGFTRYSIEYWHYDTRDFVPTMETYGS